LTLQIGLFMIVSIEIAVDLIENIGVHHILTVIQYIHFGIVLFQTIVVFHILRIIILHKNIHLRIAFHQYIINYIQNLPNKYSNMIRLNLVNKFNSILSPSTTTSLSTPINN